MEFQAYPSKATVSGKEFIVGIIPWVPYSEERLKELQEEYERVMNEKIMKHQQLEDSLKTKQVQVSSNSDPDKKYTVTIYSDGKHECDCRGFGFRKTCSHIEKVKKGKA